MCSLPYDVSVLAYRKSFAFIPMLDTIGTDRLEKRKIRLCRSSCLINWSVRRRGFPLAFVKGRSMPSNFFDESEEQSAIKTAIVSKYFMAWAQVLADSQIPAFGRGIAKPCPSDLDRACSTATRDDLVPSDRISEEYPQLEAQRCTGSIQGSDEKSINLARS